MRVNLEDMSRIVYVLKILVIGICSFYTFIKITNNKEKYNTFWMCLLCLIMSIIVMMIKYRTNSLISNIFLVLIISCICSTITKYKIGYCIVISSISLAINYILFFIIIIITFALNKVIHIENDFVNLIFMTIFHTVVLTTSFKIRKFKYGIIFLQKNSTNEYFEILILNISISILFSIIMFSNFKILLSRSMFFGIIAFSIIMFITIQKSLQLYYKQKLVMKELNETKEELENKKKEIEELEKENLNFSKTSHSLAHKQKALEFKINELMTKSEISEEYDIKERVQNLSKEIYGKTTTVELSKTGITEIDNMLKYMQSECNKNKIEFNLQIIGNIYSMINNIINKDDLEILLADHIKNAIIAVNHSENINRSILVKIGKIDNIYSLYIYDSGIEFEEETLTKLGKIPSTTHANEGGTGMGFMNTFDTLSKYDASLTINEFNKPNKDNYTKAIIIKFDKKNEFKIISYREKIEK